MRTNINAPMALLAAFFMYSCSQPAPSAQTQASAPANQAPKWGMVIHTGAGNFTLAGIAERKDAMQAAMNEALMAGYRVLAGGGASQSPVAGHQRLVHRRLHRVLTFCDTR